MQSKLLLQFLNIIGLIVVLVLNSLSNGSLVPGRTIGGISDTYPTLFTPAGMTFAIWGLIYLLLIGFVIYQGRDMFSTTKIDMPFLRQIGPWFLISCFANSVWLFPWLYQRPLLALVLMLLLLGSLMMIYFQLEIGIQAVGRPEKWLVHAPFSLYLGWITVATIANISIALKASEWGGWGFSEDTWTMIMISAAGVIGFAVALFRSDLVYALVIIWALYGIITAREGGIESTGNERIILSAYVSMGMVLVGVVIGTLRAAPRLGYIQ